MVNIEIPERTSTSETPTPPIEPIEGRVTKDKVNDQFEAYYKELVRTKAETKQLEDDVEKRIERLELSQNRVIETIGIFAALLSFIAFEAQIFKGPLSPATLIGISAIIFGALTFFVLLLDLAFDAFKQQRNLRYGLFGLATACIILGFGSAKFGYSQNSSDQYLTKEQAEIMISEKDNDFEDNIDSIEERLSKIESEDDLIEFKNCILRKGLTACL